MKLNSLKARLLISAFLVIVIVLPLIGVTLSNAFESQLKVAINNELSAYSYSILAVAEVEDKTLYVPEQLHEDQFNVSQSGLYALFTLLPQNKQAQENIPENSVLWRSNSLISINNPAVLPEPAIGTALNSEVMFEGKQHLLYSFSVSFAEIDESNLSDNIDEETLIDEFPVTLHILKDMEDYQLMISQFNRSLWSWLFGLILVLLIVQLVWLLWTIKPLSMLEKELKQIQQGNSDKLKKLYPDELQNIASQLNSFIDAEQKQQARYRNALSDLAHSLKTPLAVIQSSDDLSELAQQQLEQINVTIEHQLKRAQSAGGNAQQNTTQVNGIVEQLLSSFAKIYHDKHLGFDIELVDNLRVQCDEGDLMEILGNLIDNACKAANEKIIIAGELTHRGVAISIHDDGSGIAIEKQQTIFDRGVRLDSYEVGTGVGLAVAKDIVQSYNGVLHVSDSTRLSGAIFTVIL